MNFFIGNDSTAEVYTEMDFLQAADEAILEMLEMSSDIVYGVGRFELDKFVEGADLSLFSEGVVETVKNKIKAIIERLKKWVKDFYNKAKEFIKMLINKFKKTSKFDEKKFEEKVLLLTSGKVNEAVDKNTVFDVHTLKPSDVEFDIIYKVCENFTKINKGSSKEVIVGTIDKAKAEVSELVDKLKADLEKTEQISIADVKVDTFINLNEDTFIKGFDDKVNKAENCIKSLEYGLKESKDEVYLKSVQWITEVVYSAISSLSAITLNASKNMIKDYSSIYRQVMTTKAIAPKEGAFVHSDLEGYFKLL